MLIQPSSPDPLPRTPPEQPHDPARAPDAAPAPAPAPVPDVAPAPAPVAGPAPAGHADGRRATVWLAVIGAAILAGSALFAAGFLLGRQTVLTDGTPPQLAADLQPFWDAFDSIEQRYAGLPVDRRAIVEGAISGMFKALGDPFSAYMTGEAYRASLTSVSGQFEGIGATIATEDPSGNQGCEPAGPACRVVVVRPIPGSPAERAGIRPGDGILAVDGREVTGLTIDQVVALVRGPRGTPVNLRIGRGSAPPFDLRIVRAIVTTEDVTSRLVAGGTLGYIQVSGFGAGVAADFKSQLRSLLANGARGIVLDLRGNPGGLIDQARTIASQFIASGPIYWEQQADGSRTPVDAEPGGVATSRALPVAVLVDKGTASASEILAGALQDSGRGILIGSTTYGKGTVQEWQLLGQDMGGFKLTIARWLTPSQRWINGTGLTPNIAVTTPASATAGGDPVLARAIQVLSTKLAPAAGTTAVPRGAAALAFAAGSR